MKKLHLKSFSMIEPSLVVRNGDITVVKMDAALHQTGEITMKNELLQAN